ncbi:MAG: Outer membrane porin protein 32 [Paracidovorax wautersii]|uniref:Outer membrane porin protein 32 n=1 Tax=Paracidovorax wautersii TaxID=1177982 RepID=A0A7V8FKJ7_9BURK|nr:MAG: Outer membrane porin protein 32 [Paracidovorax wautersii]
MSAISTGAFAQSSVSIYGRIDVGYKWSNINTPKFSQNSGQVTGSRLGFVGTEDLGNGLRAGFVVEQGFAADNGESTLNGGLGGRQSFVSLSHKQWGEIRAGRQYALTDDQAGNYAPFSTSGYAFGASSYILNDDQSRLNNALTYATPKLGNFTVRLQAGTKESNSNGALTNSSTTVTTGESRAHYAGALIYANGPAAFSLTLSKNYGNDTNLDRNNKLITQIGGSYDLGGVKLFANYEHDGTKAGYGVAGSSSFGKKNAYLIGVNVPAGPWILKAALGYAENANRATRSTVQGAVKQASIGADYNFSKRTRAYVGAGLLNGDFDGKGLKTDQRKAKSVVTGLIHTF